jgi:RNA polymerase sigma factor (sigma-70 family)
VRKSSAGDGSVNVAVEVEVANFYPAIASRLGRWLYAQTQSRIHVVVTQGFLRSLARLDLEPSVVGRYVGVDEVPEAPTQQLDPESHSILSERQRVLWQHISTLTPRCQELLRVIAFADRPDYAAIAESLGMPVGSIGPTRGRCLQKLRTTLGSDPGWAV